MTLRSTVISVIVGMTSVVAPVAAQEPLVQLRRAQARGGGLHADALRLDGRLRMAAFGWPPTSALRSNRRRFAPVVRAAR
jgi:hypothetical protein